MTDIAVSHIALGGRNPLNARAALCLFAFLICWLGTFAEAGEKKTALPYVITDTGQNVAYDNYGRPIRVKPEQPLFGQDAHYASRSMAFRDNGDGTISDLNTGLMWQKNPAAKRLNWDDAMGYAAKLKLAGFADWRLPSIKELTSLADFSGSIRTRKPYIDTKYFGFAYGDPKQGQRDIDSQYWSRNKYLGQTMFGDASAFGFNFADAHIKAYPISLRGRRGRGPNSGRVVLCVRGNTSYGKNDFHDNGDGTITDRATGLVWAQEDSIKPMTWQQALAYAESLKLAGHGDWRLPDAKELQSIVDYSRAPDAKAAARRSPAIDPIFKLTNPEAWHWTSTSHGDNLANAIYVCFGRGMSVLKNRSGEQVNAHGAGALRSDPKIGDPKRWEKGMGPQSDEVRILNYVRCVRGGEAKVTQSTEMPKLPAGAQGNSNWPKHFIERLDADKDGKVSQKEFDGPARHFKHMDRNGDGFISEDEAPKGPPPRRRHRR